MFIGVGYRQALEHYSKGEEVLVIDRGSKGRNGRGYDTFLLEELLEDLEFLADVSEADSPDPNEAREDGEPPAETTKKEMIRKLMEQGMGTKEIAAKTGISYGTAAYYMSAIRKEKKGGPKGDNVDRHLCRTCKYKAKNKGCDYYVMTDRERGCDPEECDKYEEADAGAPKRSRAQNK